MEGREYTGLVAARVVILSQRRRDTLKQCLYSLLSRLALGVLIVLGLGLQQHLKADIVYTAVSLTTSQLSLTITPAGSTTNLWDTLVQATNNGTQTLFNVYEFSDNPTINSVATTLVNAGEYQQSPGTETATASNAAIYITTSQLSGYTFSAGGAGSPTIPQIPGFLIAASLAPGQTVDFNEDFILPSPASLFSFGFVDAAAAVPEPSSMPLLTVGGAFLFYALRRKRRRLS